MKFHKILMLIVLILAISINSCIKEETVINSNNQQSQSTIIGVVKDRNGSNLSGVNVSVGSNSTISDIYGKFTLTKVEQGEKVKVNFSKSGFVSTQKLTKTIDNKTLQVNSSLAQIDISAKITNTGGEIDFNGATVSFPANAFVDSKGNPINTSVTVNATYFDPTNKEFYNMFPGEFEGKRTDGSITMIESFGFIDVELMVGTEKVNLAPGKEATIKINLSSAISDNAPATIPLWYFDINQGIWLEEGIATKKGNSYIGKVKHFTPWNYDQPISNSFIEGNVTDQNGKALYGVKVASEGVGYFGRTCAYTDELGHYKLIVKANSVANVYAAYSGFESKTQKVNTLPENQILKIDNLIINIEVIEKNGWYNQISGTSVSLYDVFFIDENEGWILGYKIILHTTNGGINWNILDSYPDAGGSKIYFKTNKIGWITGSQLYKTTDGGNSWDMELKDELINKVKFFDANNGYLIGKSFFKTSDGGVNWTKLMDTLHDVTLFKNGEVVDNNNLLGFYWGDGMYKSIDGGLTWADFKSTLEGQGFYFMNSIQFLDLNYGFFCAGSDVCKTIDGGLNWNKVFITSNDKQISNIFFINKLIGYAISSDGMILFTSDGGNTWTQQKSNYSKQLKSIFFINDKKGWIVGDNGTILHTDNGGIE